MSEIPAAGNNSAFEDALLRAKEIASKIKPTENSTSTSSLKRPLTDDLEDPFSAPESKKIFSTIDPYANMMQAGGDLTEAGIPATENILVPNKMVGLIIGRGGEQITRLQSESGCKIQMAQDSAGLQERQCTLTGSPQAIAMAKSAIDRIIANEGSGGNRGPHQGGVPGGAGGGFFEMAVPGHKVGLIIGKGGETIKHLQEATGAKIVIIQDSAEYDTEKPLRITGTPDSVERAESMVNEILNQNDDRDMGGFGRGRGRGRGGPTRGFMGGGGGGRGGFNDRGPGHWGGAPGAPGGGGGGYGDHQDYISVPASKCGLVIGKGGETIKNINQTTGAHCTVDKNAPPDAEEKNFIIRGAPDAVERAKAMILEKLGMSGAEASAYGGASRGGAAAGYGATPYGGAVAVAQPSQQDYSAQWIDYYRSMGMTREAEAIEQQMRAARGGMPAQPVAQPAQPANGAANGADYSAQWAEYYRSIGKIKEAEAIEMQMKQKTAPQAYAAPGAQFQGGYYGGAQPPAAAAAAYQGYPGYAA